METPPYLAAPSAARLAARALIAAAFPSGAPPKDVVHPDGRKWIAIYDDCDYANCARFLAGRDWPDVTLETIRRDYRGCAEELTTFVSTEAKRYYLPAFLTICLDLSFADPDVLFDATFGLAGEEEVVSGLGLRQREAVRAWLAVMRDEDMAYLEDSISPDLLAAYDLAPWM